MKKFLPAVLLFVAVNSFGQTQIDKPVTPVSNYQTHGYINGKRLDSIDAQYAEFIWRGFSQSIGFNYGQSNDVRRGITITDSLGNPFEFEVNSLVFRLNFLYFNGWKIATTYKNEQTLPDDIILEKRTN